MKARVLVDNLTKNTLRPEWGLSIFIMHEGHMILLDTGASANFAKNAEQMGIDLAQVECGVLSHAHYDHADGLSVFFEKNKTAPFYLRQGTKENCYGQKWLFRKYVGIQKGTLEKYKDRIRYAKGDQEILPGVILMPHKTEGLERIGKQAGMCIREQGKWLPDDFAHEQSLVLRTKRGLVIFNSCSHGGADNIIREVADTYPGEKICALVGGFHLYKTPGEQVRALADRIKETGIEKIYTGHCTGKRAFGILKEELGERAEQIYTGMELTF